MRGIRFGLIVFSVFVCVLVGVAQQQTPAPQAQLAPQAPQGRGRGGAAPAAPAAGGAAAAAVPGARQGGWRQPAP